MSQTLATAAILFVFYTLLVVFHEFGHFLSAKLFRMKVEEFAVGFGKRVARLGFDGQTEYNVRLWPLGGFVRIAGMEIEDSHDGAPAAAHATDSDKIETTNIRLLEQEEAEVSNADPDGFNSRPIYQRFVVILAGPVFSLLLGWFVLCLLGVITGYPRFMIKSVLPNSVAAAAGLRSGETILSIDGVPVDFDGTLRKINGSIGTPITLTVREPNGTSRSVGVTPKADKQKGELVAVGRIGIAPAEEAHSYNRVSVAESFSRGTRMTGFYFEMMYAMIRTGAIKDNVGGVIKIAKAPQQAAKNGAFDTLALLGQLSLSLGLINLFPIPVMDGGHLMLMWVELFRGKKLTASQTGIVLTIGIVLIAVLAAAIFVKDVLGLIPHH
jgi:regulator of sigma E protease